MPVELNARGNASFGAERMIDAVPDHGGRLGRAPERRP
jgi:hypothetical protein